MRLVFMNYPLPMHPNAMNSAMASVAAGKQGKFWSYHDKLFENQDKQTMADLVRYAMEMKLDVTKFQADMQAARERVEKIAPKAKSRADRNAWHAGERLQSARRIYRRASILHRCGAGQMTRLRLAIATLCFSVSLGVAAAGQQAGKPAADFSLPDAAQKTVRLSDLRGKVVLLLDFGRLGVNPACASCPSWKSSTNSLPAAASSSLASTSIAIAKRRRAYQSLQAVVCQLVDPKRPDRRTVRSAENADLVCDRCAGQRPAGK